ncbi:phiKZ-like phage internal head protein [compost metagenome]
MPAFVDSGKNLDGINAAGFKAAYGRLIADIKEVIKDVAGTPSEKSDKGDKRQVLAARAGFSIYLAYEDKYESDEEVLAAARSVKLSFGKTEGAKEFAKGEEVDVKASKAQLQGLLNTVASSVSVMRDSKITQKFSKAERDRVVATLTVKTKESANTKEENGKAIQLVRALYSTGSSLTVSMNKLFVAQGKQALDLVAAHI